VDPTSVHRPAHGGSFLRPRAVLDARRDARVSADALRAIEDEHVLRVLARQKDLGFQIFTDGEFRRRGFMSDFYESVEGLDHDGSIARAWTSAGATGATRPLAGLVVNRIKQTKRLTEHEVTFLTRYSPGAVKMTLPSANQFP